MSARAATGTALLLLLAGALWWLGARGGSGDAPDGAGAGGAAGMPGAADTAPLHAASCRACHPAVYAEWADSMHAAAFTDPQVRAPEQSDDFRRIECLPCHAPRPLFEHGIELGTRVLARVERRVDGVDCLACHGLPGGGVAASRPNLTGACRPTYRPELVSHQACAACHDQHNTHQEWLASPAAVEGRDCADCHMERVTRTGAEAGAPRAGRSHRFLGGRDAAFAQAGYELTAAPAGDVLRVELVNRFAGHNLPTDSRNRALDLVVTFHDARGAELGPPADEPRESWERRGTARRRFRNPYRSSGQPSTQLPAGETAVLEVPIPDGAVRATVELLYKLQPFIPDEDAHWRDVREVDLTSRS